MFHRAVVVLRVPMLLLGVASIGSLFMLRPHAPRARRCCCARRGAEPAKMVTQVSLAASAISTPKPAVATDHVLDGLYKVCLAQDGFVSSVVPLTPIAGQDATIAAAVSTTWRYAPQPTPVCFTTRFLYEP
jgi:hypothetical protein